MNWVPERRGRLAETLLDRVEHPVGADARDLPLARVVVLLPLGRGDDEDRSLLHVELAGVDAAVALDGALEVRLGYVSIWSQMAISGHTWQHVVTIHYLEEVLVPPVQLRDGDGQVLQAGALVLGELRVARAHVLVLALLPNLGECKKKSDKGICKLF